MGESKVIISEHKILENEEYITIYIAGLPYIIPREIYKKLNKNKEK